MKKIIFSILFLMALGICGLLLYVTKALPDVGEAEKIQIDSSPEMIAKGKYLAHNVCACMDCHSTRDWSKFTGPLKEGTLGAGGEIFDQNMGFPGTFYSKNLTPTNLGNWTDGEIFRAITTGVTKEGKAIFPVMPYKAYAQMDRDDIMAIIAYVRTLAPITSQVAQSKPDFPMNFILNTIPQKASLQEKPAKDDILAYGKYLVNAAACTECHTQHVKGQPVEGMDFAGGFEFNLPNGLLRSANITPHQTGIGNWTKEMFIRKFKSFSDSAYVPSEVAQNGFQSIMPWMMYTGMSEEDLGAMYDYIRTLQPIENKVVRFVPADKLALAK